MACTWRKGWMLRNSSLDRGGGSPKSCWVCHFNSSANATRQYGDWFHNWVVLSCFVDWYPYVDLVGQHVLQRTWGKTHPTLDSIEFFSEVRHESRHANSYQIPTAMADFLGLQLAYNMKVFRYKIQNLTTTMWELFWVTKAMESWTSKILKDQFCSQSGRCCFLQMVMTWLWLKEES